KVAVGCYRFYRIGTTAEALLPVSWTVWGRARPCNLAYRSGRWRGVRLGLREARILRRLAREKEEGQQERPNQSSSHRVLEHRRVIHLAPDGVLGLEPAADQVRGKRTEAENQRVEQSLGAGADVLGEELVYEDVHRSEEESVANAVDDINHDGRHLLGK